MEVDAVEAGSGRFREGVLPDAEDSPSPVLDLAGDAEVEVRVGLRRPLGNWILELSLCVF